jgi:RHS repeat-associated protein
VAQVIDTYEYDAFGNDVYHTGTTPNNYLYRGEQYDPDLSLYYLRARYLNPATGRFLSVDALAGEGQRRYEYADADPVNGIDPTGNDTEEEYGFLSAMTPIPVPFPNPSWCSSGAGGPMSGSLPPCNVPPPPCAGPNCNKQYWITLAYYPQATHGFGHDGVAVGEGSPNDDDVGWATRDSTSFWKLARGASVPGLLREDSGVYGATGGRRSRMGGRQVLHFRTNQAGAEAAEELIQERKGRNQLWNSWQDYPTAWPYDKGVGNYNLYGRNCTQFAEDVLHAGEVPGVPGHEIFEPAALWGILAYGQSWSDQ